MISESSRRAQQAEVERGQRYEAAWQKWVRGGRQQAAEAEARNQEKLALYQQEVQKRAEQIGQLLTGEDPTLTYDQKYKFHAPAPEYVPASWKADVNSAYDKLYAWVGGNGITPEEATRLSKYLTRNRLNPSSLPCLTFCWKRLLDVGILRPTDIPYPKLEPVASEPEREIVVPEVVPPKEQNPFKPGSREYDDREVEIARLKSGNEIQDAVLGAIKAGKITLNGANLDMRQYRTLVDKMTNVVLPTDTRGRSTGWRLDARNAARELWGERVDSLPEEIDAKDFRENAEMDSRLARLMPNFDFANPNIGLVDKTSVASQRSRVTDLPTQEETARGRISEETKQALIDARKEAKRWAALGPEFKKAEKIAELKRKHEEHEKAWGRDIVQIDPATGRPVESSYELRERMRAEEAAQAAAEAAKPKPMTPAEYAAHVESVHAKQVAAGLRTPAEVAQWKGK